MYKLLLLLLLLLFLWFAFLFCDNQFVWLWCRLFSAGLDLLVTWLSDPDNLNQLVLNQLDSVTLKGSVEELCGSDLDLDLASQEGEGSEV